MCGRRPVSDGPQHERAPSTLARDVGTTGQEAQHARRGVSASCTHVVQDKSIWAVQYPTKSAPHHTRRWLSRCVTVCLPVAAPEAVGCAPPLQLQQAAFVKPCHALESVDTGRAVECQSQGCISPVVIHHQPLHTYAQTGPRVTKSRGSRHNQSIIE